MGVKSAELVLACARAVICVCRAAFTPQPLFTLTVPTECPAGAFTPPMVDRDGSIYVSFAVANCPQYGGYVASFSGIDGSLRWNYTFPRNASGMLTGGPILVTDYGIVFVSGMTALDSGTGKVLWTFPAVFCAPEQTQLQLPQPPSSQPTGIVYITCNNVQSAVSTFFALNAKTGGVMWRAHSPVASYAGVTLIGGQLLILTLPNGPDATGNLTSLDPVSGTQLWSHQISPFDSLYPGPASSDLLVGGLGENDEAEHGMWFHAYNVSNMGAPVWTETLALGRGQLVSQNAVYDNDLNAVWVFSLLNGSQLWIGNFTQGWGYTHAVVDVMTPQPPSVASTLLLSQSQSMLARLDFYTGQQLWLITLQRAWSKLTPPLYRRATNDVLAVEVLWPASQGFLVHCWDFDSGAEKWQFPMPPFASVDPTGPNVDTLFVNNALVVTFPNAVFAYSL